MSYQSSVWGWLVTCFGQEVAGAQQERCHRFFEEATELCQSLNCTAEECHQIVDYVFGREIGEPNQELGGTLVCLAALSTVAGLDMEQAGWKELCRCWEKMDKIRKKHASKPKFSPLPGDAV